MYYSNGNYEAFARPRKPNGAENKTAWVVGSGLAALAGAAFLIRDGQISGDKINILEQHQLPGGALDGIKEPNKGLSRISGGRVSYFKTGTYAAFCRTRETRKMAER
ncbi:MAG: hypothetical protein EOM24_35075, partial [Chloroflexia bacterium]|nr:hypothetical protein [Chloroflexia bacterium]